MEFRQHEVNAKRPEREEAQNETINERANQEKYHQNRREQNRFAATVINFTVFKKYVLVLERFFLNVTRKTKSTDILFDCVKHEHYIQK